MLTRCSQEMATTSRLAAAAPVLVLVLAGNGLLASDVQFGPSWDADVVPLSLQVLARLCNAWRSQHMFMFMLNYMAEVA